MGPQTRPVQQRRRTHRPAAARELLPRRALDRKECAEDRLLLVEIEGVGAAKEAADLVAQLGPARCRRPLAAVAANALFYFSAGTVVAYNAEFLPLASVLAAASGLLPGKIARKYCEEERRLTSGAGSYLP